MEPAKAPGLKFRPRKSGSPVPYWIASAAAVKAGYTPKSVRLHTGDIIGACQRHQAEMLLWLSGQQDADKFDGSFRSLFNLYETDPESSFHRLKRSSREPYGVYLRKLYAHIGDCRISATDGRDLKRWHALWASPPAPGKPERTASAHLCVSIIRAAVSFGVACRKPGCAEFKTVLDVLKFAVPKPRTQAPTAAQVSAVRAAAHASGHPSRALAYAIQFEAGLRQWDVIGEWWPLSDARPSGVLGKGEKWLGPTWSNIDSNLVLRLTPGKTAGTSGVTVAIDLRECPWSWKRLRESHRSAAPARLSCQRQQGCRTTIEHSVTGGAATRTRQGYRRPYGTATCEREASRKPAKRERRLTM
jgi:hypothetical protein